MSGLGKASPLSCNTLAFLQCAALGLGEGERGEQLPRRRRERRGEEKPGWPSPGPARPAHREGVVYVEGNLPPLEGELLLPVSAHRHQPRHRLRCGCCCCRRRHDRFPAAAAAAATAAAAAPAATAASSLLLPATAKPRERKERPPRRRTFATGGERGEAAHGLSVFHRPIQHARSQSASRNARTRPPLTSLHPPFSAHAFDPASCQEHQTAEENRQRGGFPSQSELPQSRAPPVPEFRGQPLLLWPDCQASPAQARPGSSTRSALPPPATARDPPPSFPCSPLPGAPPQTRRAPALSGPIPRRGPGSP